MKTIILSLLSLLILTIIPEISSWAEWNYTIQWSENPNAVASAITQWTSVWSSEKYAGDPSPPRARRGHSLHIIKTDERSEYGGESYIFMFGGRDNDQVTVQIPKTYNIETIDGVIQFTTYDEKPVNPCDDPEGKYYSELEREGCNYTTSSLTNIGLSYNDVWAYKLCNQTERSFDGPCNNTGWIMVYPGASQGGCNIELGITVCTAPSERYNHGSVLFDDGTLYVYGGFSQRCTDFCDDLWFFDIYLKSWREVYTTGTLTKFYNDTLFGEVIQLNETDVPITNTTSKYAGPAKRWRHSMVLGDSYFDPSDGFTKQQMAIFGGHRLWHGFSPENSQTNNWNIYETRPRGGYLDDLWIYTKYLDFNFPASAYKTAYGTWQLMPVLQRCYQNASDVWSTRNDISCITIRPAGRAGHGSAFDSRRNIVWIFGGYTTYYPYLSTDGTGSGFGVSSVGTGGFTPYPSYDYFRNDLWYYNLTDNLWYEVLVTDADLAPIPDPRMEMVFLLIDDLLFVHGGFSDNYIYGDTWYFNITSSRWLQKTTFVRPIYPPSCTDDFKFIEENNCTELMFPRALERDGSPPYDILPYGQQRYYWPDSNFGPYYGIVSKDFAETHRNRSFYTGEGGSLNLSLAAEGTPIFPYAATGVMQYAKPFIYPFNATHNATLVASCMSVFGEPTRGRVLDGLFGRASSPVIVPQPRPRKPGWDGCRDRADGRQDLPAGLQYVQPQPRYGHRAIYNRNTTEIIMYGGMAYETEQAKSLKTSYPQSVRDDMWYYNFNHCANNCSFNGDCYFGFCFCYVGFYGVDCSNMSCPGTFCHYNYSTNEQICTHACHAGYSHYDGDTYVQDIAKLPCTEEKPGESNGICNGFGTAMCAPPYITEDCSVKDCPHNCSFNGWCSVEYPVSRCNCQPGYFGEYCQNQTCLNNCSYPNGICNTTSGQCMCNMVYNPYNNSRNYRPWGGEDCSYIWPFQSAPKPIRLFGYLYLALMVVVTMMLAGALAAPCDTRIDERCHDTNNCLNRFHEEQTSSGDTQQLWSSD